MKQLRVFVPIVLLVPVLAACGGSSGSSGAASAQAKAIASAEAQAAAKASSSPSADASTGAPSGDASSAVPSGGGSDTCPDQTINGYKITDVLLTEGATCAQLSKVAASPQIGGSTFDWPVDGFHCAAATVNLITCDLDNSNAEINFTATK